MAARILIVEDNAENLKLMVYLLEAFGYRTVTAHDGVEALEILESEGVDLVVCDIQLPRMDGYEVVRRVRANPALSHVPLLAVTAYAMVGDREKTLSVGFDSYIPKPINPQTFVTQMETLLPRAQHSAKRSQQHVAEPGGPAATETRRDGPVLSGEGECLGTILMVDNSFDNIHVVRSALEPFGYVLHSALSVAEGLALARKHRPDLILSDVYIAGESGYDFIQDVKADPDLCSIPFVFISSTTWAEAEMGKALLLGAAAFVVRPIDPQSLLDKIGAYLVKRN